MINGSKSIWIKAFDGSIFGSHCMVSRCDSPEPITSRMAVSSERIASIAQLVPPYPNTPSARGDLRR